MSKLVKISLLFVVFIILMVIILVGNTVNAANTVSVVGIHQRALVSKKPSPQVPVVKNESKHVHVSIRVKKGWKHEKSVVKTRNNVVRTKTVVKTTIHSNMKPPCYYKQVIYCRHFGPSLFARKTI
jgi:hypothetical protein